MGVDLRGGVGNRWKVQIIEGEDREKILENLTKQSKATNAEKGRILASV